MRMPISRNFRKMVCVFRGISAYCFSLETRHQFKSKFFSSDFNIKEEAHFKGCISVKEFFHGENQYCYWRTSFVRQKYSCKILAKQLNYVYCDTGAMYRAITYLALQNQIDIQAEEPLVALCVNHTISFQQAKNGQRVLSTVMKWPKRFASQM